MQLLANRYPWLKLALLILINGITSPSFAFDGATIKCVALSKIKLPYSPGSVGGAERAALDPLAKDACQKQYSLPCTPDGNLCTIYGNGDVACGDVKFTLPYQDLPSELFKQSFLVDQKEILCNELFHKENPDLKICEAQLRAARKKLHEFAFSIGSPLCQKKDVHYCSPEDSYSDRFCSAIVSYEAAKYFKENSRSKGGAGPNGQ